MFFWCFYYESCTFVSRKMKGYIVMTSVLNILQKGFLLLFAGVPLSSQVHYEKTRKELENYLRKTDRERLAEDYRNIAQDLYSALDQYKEQRG